MIIIVTLVEAGIKWPPLTDTFKRTLLNGNIRIAIKILMFVSENLINNIPALV